MKQVKNFKGYPTLSLELNAIVHPAHNLGGEGFSNMTADDVEELDSHKKNSQQRTFEVVDGHMRFWWRLRWWRWYSTGKQVQDFLKSAEGLYNKIMDIDPPVEQNIKFKHSVAESLLPYKEVFKHLQINTKQQSK